MFLYTSRKSCYLWHLYSICLQMLSLLIIIRHPHTLRLFILFILFYRIPLSQISKGLFFTGMYICRTTNILNCNKLYTVHGTFTSFSYTSTTLRTRFWLFYKLCLPGKWLLLRYWIDKSYLVWIDLILSYRLLFVNTFLEYFSNKFIIVYFV